MVIHIFKIRSPVFDVHGVQIRESLRIAFYSYSKAKGALVKGRIFNQHQGTDQYVQIEIFCSETTHEELHELIKKAVNNKIIRYLNSSLDEKLVRFIKEIEKEKDQRWSIEYIEDKNLDLQKQLEMLDSIVVLRDGDPSLEAAWALQGAGKVFLMVSEQITERDNQKIRNKTAGLYYELIRNQQNLHEILNDQEKNFTTNALSEFLVDLPIGDEQESKKTLIRSLQDLFHELDSLNYSTHKAVRYEDEEVRKKKVDFLGKQIGDILMLLENQYEQFGGNKNDLLAGFEKPR